MIGYGTGYNGNLDRNFPNNNFPQQQQLYGQQFPNQMQQAVQPMQQVGLNGKLVDSEEMVRATEVPLGGYGIFPKADFSEIYIKSWNNNGTTNITRYAAVAPKPILQTEETQEKILSRIDSLESKLDSFIQANVQGQPQLTKEIYPVNSTEVKKNEF